MFSFVHYTVTSYVAVHRETYKGVGTDCTVCVCRALWPVTQIARQKKRTKNRRQKLPSLSRQQAVFGTHSRGKAR